MAKPKRVANKPAASGRIAANAPAPVQFSSAKPVEVSAPKDADYVPQPMEFKNPDAISPDGSFHSHLFDIAEEVQNRIAGIKAGSSAKNKESSVVAKKAAPAEISLNKARQHIQNSIQAHKAGDSWTSTADMRDAVHHIANAVNYLNSGEGWGGEKRGTNPANFWAADSRRTEGDAGTKGPSLRNVHGDLTNILNGYLKHVNTSTWSKKNHITNSGTDFSPESITPNSQFEGYGQAPKERNFRSTKPVTSSQDLVSAAGKIIKPKYNPVANLATVPTVTRREYAKQVKSHWEANNPGKTFIGSDAHLHPELYAKQNGIDLKYPSRALFSATGDPYHLIVPSMLEKEGNLSEEDIQKIQKKETQAVSREKSKNVFTAPLDTAESQEETEAKITGAVREKPDVESPSKGGKKLTREEALPQVPAAATKLKAGDVAGAARAVWEAHYNKSEPLPSDASMGQVKQWQKVQDDAFKAHPASQNPAGFLDAHGYRVPGAGTRSMEFNAGQVK